MLIPTIEHGSGYVMIWTAISWYSAGPIITLNYLIIARNCMDILGNQVHPVVQMMFPKNDPIFQDDNSPIYIVRCFQSWFEEHEDGLNIFPDEHNC